jgi:hypothetical protein
MNGKKISDPDFPLPSGFEDEEAVVTETTA